MASLPFLGYSIVLFVIYFSQLHFLLRLFNNIGFAVIGIYLFIIAYFYLKFYNTKKDLKTEFKTPYYLQSAQFSETDLLYIKEEFTDEQMAQFGYECFGKDNDFKVLEQIEKDTIKENIVVRQQDKNIPQLYELNSELEDSSIIKNKPKHEIKYSSFLED
jgi:predicted membrane protein